MKRLLIPSALLLLSCFQNHPPDPPEITGRTGSALPDSTSTFHIHVTDPDRNRVLVRMSWGNGDMSDWKGYYASGQTLYASYVWADTGTYPVSAMAIDEHGAPSEWSEPCTCRIGLGEFPYRFIRTIECSGEPMRGLAVSPDGGYVYAGSYYSAVVSEVRTSDDSLGREIRLPDPASGPMDIVASPDGARVYVSAHRGSSKDIVFAICTSDFIIEDSVVLEGELSGMAISPGGERLYVSSPLYETNSIFVISTPAMLISDTIHLDDELCRDLYSLAVSPDGRRLYALGYDLGLLAFSTETMKMVDSLVFYAGLGLMVDPAGRYVCADSWDEGVMVIAAENLEPECVIQLPREGTFTATSPDGEYLFGVTYAGGDSSFFDVLRPPARNIVHSTPLPGVDDLAEVVLLPSGDKAYVLDHGRVHVFSR
jgi:DNA-binding beta-propeller fold protein YncE